jgi:hypothetical protein
MAERSRATLKEYFEAGDVPLESQFIDVFDSHYNKEDDVLFPSRTIYVDKEFSDNQTPFFDNISDALTAANAMSPTVSNPVTIKAFSDTDGSPIGLGDNDYYTLRDSGIVFESSYDPMQLLFKGGEVIEDEFLYEVKESEMNIEVTL